MTQAKLSDTTENAQKLYDQLHASLTPGEKLLKLCDLIATSRILILAELQSRYPNATNDEITKRFAARVVGPEFTRKYLNWDPEIEGY